MTYPELLILRHGETEWNLEGRMQGHLDSPLTARGRAQARRQGEILSGFDLGAFTLMSSPLGRTRATAQIVLPEAALARLSTDARLREIDVGDWAGQIRAKLTPSRITEFTPDGALAKYDSAPGGEGFEGLAARCAALLDALEGPHLMITHGVTSRMLRALYMGLPPRSLGELPGGQGVVFHMVRGHQIRLE
ncbi:putative phosphoglycerate mutase [Litoreibacter ponti]|uniref:Putative phosphoglycerate mutase n=1 Tax=Litoreibacter ponti TaxID=1510457 RepID=A0A2T6BI90_9RHOB|nr:histidine phosphatase family protein [Litoreibacter ponti]PTX55766.1 putative phosphoglycerate mutase [Litoreibacter ponti]